MTKKDYDLVAWALRLAKDDTVKDAMLSVAYAFEHNYPKFNRDKFLVACGINPYAGFKRFEGKESKTDQSKSNIPVNKYGYTGDNESDAINRGEQYE